jgi:hypothetical protein
MTLHYFYRYLRVPVHLLAFTDGKCSIRIAGRSQGTFPVETVCIAPFLGDVVGSVGQGDASHGILENQVRPLLRQLNDELAKERVGPGKPDPRETAWIVHPERFVHEVLYR